MVYLKEVDENNWKEIAALELFEEQKSFLDTPLGIVARGYVYRNCNAKVFGIANEEKIIGAALIRDFDEEPVGYDLQQFMIDKNFQNKGYGRQALELILNYLKAEKRFDRVEICVKKADIHAIKLYEKAGFKNSGYFDESVPDCVNLIYFL
ncbi:MAG: GNAT family N-acetyltransferase [Oscillospiraceae bacterium]|nr:GNAT family N-acetyltransferase [Oscillospiraceae bacterium]